LNTLDLSGCPDALAAFDGIGTLDSVGWDYDAVYERIGGYDAYLSSTSVPVDNAIVARAERLKVIGSPSTGTDHLDLEAIGKAGIACFDISQEWELINGFTATSELAFALLLALNRKICQAAAATRDGDWARERFTGFQLHRKTLGILGLGRLGTISARIGNGFGMRVIAHDVRDVTAPDVALVDFDTLFRESDALTIHVHLRPETRGLVSRQAIAAMKPNAILINTSRGAIVDETALLDALQTGRIGGAGLDVIDGEWLDDVGSHPLVCHARAHDNLIISPHIGGATNESIYDARLFMARKVADYLKSLHA
jgi:D-3-phosphoglycerate dehydrogenase